MPSRHLSSRTGAAPERSSGVPSLRCLSRPTSTRSCAAAMSGRRAPASAHPLGNYLAGAVMMPYSRSTMLRSGARHASSPRPALRRASSNPIATTLQRRRTRRSVLHAWVDQPARPKAFRPLVPFSQFAAPALWNVHATFDTRENRHPVIERRTHPVFLVRKRARAVTPYARPAAARRHRLGCELKYASRRTYLDGLKLAPPPIDGVIAAVRARELQPARTPLTRELLSRPTAASGPRVPFLFRVRARLRALDFPVSSRGAVAYILRDRPERIGAAEGTRLGVSVRGRNSAQKTFPHRGALARRLRCRPPRSGHSPSPLAV